MLIFFEKIPRPIREAALSVDVIGLMLGEPQVGCNIMRSPVTIECVKKSL